MTVQQDRELFNLGEAAKGLASQVGVTEPWSGNGSDRFAHFADERRFVIVAGPQEGSYVDLAFAQGLEQRGSRRLVLILRLRSQSPSEKARVSNQRSWLPSRDGWQRGPGRASLDRPRSTDRTSTGCKP